MRAALEHPEVDFCIFDAGVFKRNVAPDKSGGIIAYVAHYVPMHGEKKVNDSKLEVKISAISQCHRTIPYSATGKYRIDILCGFCMPACDSADD